MVVGCAATTLCRVLAFFAVLTLLIGCAGDGPREMHLSPRQTQDGARMFWPATPELARYAFTGELLGEQNFPLKDANSKRSDAVRFLRWLAGIGLDEERPLVLQRPQSGTTDATGRILVTDVSHRAVFVFDPTTAKLDVWSFAVDGVAFKAPIGIVAARDNEYLVTDAELGAVFRFDQHGKPIGSFGKDVLQRPTGIARDAGSGRIFVADTRANDIKIFDADGVLVDYVGRSGNAAGELNAPTYLTFANDRLYVTDTLNSRVQVFDRDGNPRHIFGERGLYVGNLARPKGIAADSEGNIYVVEALYDHLLIFDRNGRFLLPIGGTGKEPGQFYLPSGVWTDDNNRIFVADMFNGRVAIFQFLGGS